MNVSKCSLYGSASLTTGPKLCPFLIRHESGNVSQPKIVHVQFMKITSCMCIQNEQKSGTKTKQNSKGWN